MKSDKLNKKNLKMVISVFSLLGPVFFCLNYSRLAEHGPSTQRRLASGEPPSAEHFAGRLELAKDPTYDSAKTTEEYCEKARDLRNFQVRLARVGVEGTEMTWQERLAIFGQRSYMTELAFRNQSGVFGFESGLCWWHSRLQRSAAYLTIFRPLKEGEKAMDDDEIRQAVQDVIQNRRVVEFRGFNGLHQLTDDKRSLFLSELSSWAEEESLRLGWIKGLKGSSSEDPEDLEEEMDQLYRDVEQRGRVVYQMQQIPGPAAHAWLVVGMDPTLDAATGQANGYVIHYADSNHPQQLRSMAYQKGQDTFRHYDFKFNFVPYTQLDADFGRIGSAILAKCNPAVYKKRLVKALYLDPRFNSTTIAGWAVYDKMADIVAQYKRHGTPADIPVIGAEEFDVQHWTSLIAGPSLGGGKTGTSSSR